MLINDHVCLERGQHRLFLAGLDDHHYFRADDLGRADQGIPQHSCKIMVCHSPEKYKEVADQGYGLYLAGHTHGGQICLPGGIALVSSATVPRRMIRGPWRYGHMTGYTSKGIGASGVMARFCCAPEITLITLKCTS
jgi:predicted MPP superfamily phosphohydrolase